MINTSQRTIEFLIPIHIPICWYEDLTRVWNQALFFLNWRQHYQRILQCREQGIAIDPYIEIAARKAEDEWQLYQKTEVDRRIDKTKSWDAENIETVPVNRIPYKFHSVNRCWSEEPPIDWKTKVSAIDLRKPFARKRCEWLAESTIPQTYVNDFIGLVVVPAWEAYQKGQRGKPRYKKPGELVETIACESFRATCTYSGDDTLRLPGIGKMQINGLDYRLMDSIAVMVQGMTANPDRYPALQIKLDKIMQTDRSKLIKADGVDLKKMRKELSEEAFDELLATYTDRVDTSGHLAKAIEYFSSPGSFKIIRRDGKTYLQIGAEMPTHSRETVKQVTIETGLDLLVSGSNGLVVKHQDLRQFEARLVGLDKAISRCVHGSNAWAKLMAKKRKLEGQIKRSKKAYQTYHAAHIATVNADITVNQIKVKPATGLPIPRPDGEGGYLPNGATKAHEQNKLIHDRALGQFVLLLSQQSKRHGRKLTKVEIAAPDSASPEDNSPSNSATDEMVARKGIGGKRKRLPRSTQKQASVSANPPKPIEFKPRNRKREKAIG
jgi:hypothetical protein